jgi:hypothetical protein
VLRVAATAVCLYLLLAMPTATAQQRRHPTEGQRATRSASVCRLSIDNAPEVRGLKLRQQVAEVLKAFPTLEREGREELGAISFAHTTRVGEEDLNPSALSGVEMLRLTFLDNRLYYIVISYGEYEPSGVSDFIRQATTTMHLPAAGWKREGSSATLACEGFSVTVQTGKEGDRVDYLALIISDTRAEAEYVRRYKARQAKRQHEEAERRRREEERHRVFKP